MSKKVRSAKGELVDFDLLQVKEQISNQPTPQDVRARQDFIEKRLRRRLKKVPTPPPAVKNEDREVSVDPKMPAPETLSDEPKLNNQNDDVEQQPRSKQKARPPAKKKNDT